jgi:hypothetical protein
MTEGRLYGRDEVVEVCPPPMSVRAAWSALAMTPNAGTSTTIKHLRCAPQAQSLSLFKHCLRLHGGI